jgi:hypothetical protein
MLLQRVLQGHISGHVESTKDSGVVRWTACLEHRHGRCRHPKMTITIGRVDCDMMKRVRARPGSFGAACNFHDHKTAGIARHVGFRLADASA